MKTGKLLVVWLIIVASFVSHGILVYGYKEGSSFDVEVTLTAVLFEGGFGFSIATCLLVGIYAVSRVRAKSLKKGIGILLVLFSSALGAVAPPAIMACSGLFHGETGMAIYSQAVVTVGTGILAFVVFSSTILLHHTQMDTNKHR